MHAKDPYIPAALDHPLAQTQNTSVTVPQRARKHGNTKTRHKADARRLMMGAPLVAPRPRKQGEVDDAGISASALAVVAPLEGDHTCWVPR